MNRLKWQKSTNNSDSLDFKKLSKLLLRKRYEDDATSGFLIDELMPNHLASRYILKRIVKQQIETLFGEVIDNEFISYDTTRFRVSDTRPGIELITPPQVSHYLFKSTILGH